MPLKDKGVLWHDCVRHVTQSDKEGSTSDYISAGPEAGRTLRVNVANQSANHQRREKPHRARLHDIRPRSLL